MTEQWGERLANDIGELKAGHAEMRTKLDMYSDAVVQRLDKINGSVGRHDAFMHNHLSLHERETAYNAGKSEAAITKRQLAMLKVGGKAGWTIASGVLAFVAGWASRWI